MREEWSKLIIDYKEAGARAKFEEICASLVGKTHLDVHSGSVEVKQGDGGIDVLVGEIGLEPIIVYQCKFFTKGIGKSQKGQVKKSFETAINSPIYKMKSWTLCIANELTVTGKDQTHQWWVKWKNDMLQQHNLPNDFIKLWDGGRIINLLQEKQIYDVAFGINYFNEEELRESFKKASLGLENINNQFGINTNDTHINKKETDDIIQWVLERDSNKNLLVLEGEKGMGKSVIFKDVYSALLKEECLVLGIKSDKNYGKSIPDLESNLFVNAQITFTKIEKFIKLYKKKLILIIDQIDALSQSLSASRSSLSVYNRLIEEFIDVAHVKIIISSRTYDLDFDAELKSYRKRADKVIKATSLELKQVEEVLNLYNITNLSNRLLSFLTTPNHLNIFCNIAKKNKKDWDTIKTLTNLYDRLWDDIINNTDSQTQIYQLLFDIARKMYANQEITVSKKPFERYTKGLNYLASQCIIKIEEGTIQFFHQTFYDYCFARQFVEEGEEAIEYIQDNNQGLEIRSIVKMILDYSREDSPKNHIKLAKELIAGDNYRFHIKLIVLNLMSRIEQPTEPDKKVIRDYILTNEIYLDTFMEAVKSEGWLNYFIKNDLIYKKILEGGKHRELARVFCVQNINIDPYFLVKYLDELPDFEGKEIFIKNQISQIKNWGNNQLLSYFKKYISYECDQEDNWIYFRLLMEIMNHHPTYVRMEMKKITTTLFELGGYNVEISYDFKALLKKAYKKNQETVFEAVFEAYKIVLESYKERILGKSSYYHNSQFSDNSAADKDATLFIENFLVEHLVSIDENSIRKFYMEHKDTDAVYLIRILFLVFTKLDDAFIHQIYELFTIVDNKNGFGGEDDNFQLYTRQLLKKVFTKFSEEQQKNIIDIIWNLSYVQALDLDKYEYAAKKKRIKQKSFDEKKYLFMRCIPQAIILENQKLKKSYLELERKSKNDNIEKALDVKPPRQVIVVQPPLDKLTYDKMNLEQWRKSMYKYDTNERNWGNMSKGGVAENSSVFLEKVRARPDYFYDFIVQLFEDKRIAFVYLLKGVEGVVKSTYNIVNKLFLYKKLYVKFSSHEQVKRILYVATDLISQKGIDNEVMSFFINNIKNSTEYDQKQKLDTPYGYAQTVDGYSLTQVIDCYQQQEYKNQIFEVVEHVLKEGKVHMKRAISSKLANLCSLDVERSYPIFIKLLQQFPKEIAKENIQVCNYYNTFYHNEMQVYFDTIIENEGLHKYGGVIIISYLDSKIGDKKLYQKFIKGSINAKLCAIDIAVNELFNIKDNNDFIKEKSLAILTSFLREDNAKLANAYSVIISKNLDVENFEKYYSFLFNYSKSKLCEQSSRYFLELLEECVFAYPIRCLSLLENIDFLEMKISYDIEDKPVSLILLIYSVLTKDTEKYKEELETALDIFDEMLQNVSLKQRSKQRLDELLSDTKSNFCLLVGVAALRGTNKVQKLSKSA